MRKTAEELAKDISNFVNGARPAEVKRTCQTIGKRPSNPAAINHWPVLPVPKRNGRETIHRCQEYRS